MRERRFRGVRKLALHPLLTLLVALLASGDGRAQEKQAEAVYAVKGVAANDVLNIRDEPGGKHILAHIPPHARGVIALGPRAKSGGGTWAQVRFGSSTGWVNMRFLAPDDVQTSSAASGALPAAALRGERFNGTWSHPALSLVIDADQIIIKAQSTSDQPSQLLAAGSRDCGNVYERNLADLAIEAIPATFTDPRFHSWARSATRDRSLLLLIVTCGSPSRRFFFFLTSQQKMLVAEWAERSWLMYEEFEHGLRHVGR
jgi:hypothetical protein